MASDQPGGRVLLLPGSSGRANDIAQRFENRATFPSQRNHDVFLGTVPGANGPVDVGVVSTGMGCPSVDIIVTELLSVGACCFLRVGTCGSLQSHVVRAGDVVIATGAVRDEGASLAYAPPEFPAVASGQVVSAALAAAGASSFGDRVHVGVVHTKDSLYAREFGLGPAATENERYMERLSALGVLASEMEAAHLFVLAQVHSGTGVRARACRVHAGCVLAVIGGAVPFDGEVEAADAVDRVIDLGLTTAARLPDMLG